ncbi:MAG: tetratricopeptide repeat protein [Gammaproteobacteria bacterium]
MSLRYLLLLACCLGNVALAEDRDTMVDTEALMQQAQTAFDQADIVNAMVLYRRAAEAGHAPAQARLAYLLDNSEANEEAVSWYRMAAEQGDAEGLFGLAHMYAAGEGIEKNPQEAVKGFTLAAQQGHAQAIRVLAQAYEMGELGLKVNYAQAVSWLNAGVAAQDAWSIRRLARAYRMGELGQRIDTEQAAFLEGRLVHLSRQPANTP